MTKSPLGIQEIKYGLSASDINNDHNLASSFYEIIKNRIADFENKLDDEHEVAIKLSSFGQSVTLYVTDIGYSNPSTLIFYGFVNGQDATLIQHVSQLNFLLISVKKDDVERPVRRIGFELSTED